MPLRRRTGRAASRENVPYSIWDEKMPVFRVFLRNRKEIGKSFEKSQKMCYNILIYGRPSVELNAFNLLVAALKKCATIY